MNVAIPIPVPTDYEDSEMEMSSEDKEVYGDYEKKMRAESDVHTLTEASMIKRDAERYKMAKHCAKKRMRELKAVMDNPGEKGEKKEKDMEY